MELWKNVTITADGEKIQDEWSFEIREVPKFQCTDCTL